MNILLTGTLPHRKAFQKIPLFERVFKKRNTLVEKLHPGSWVTYSNWVTDRLCDIPVSTGSHDCPGKLSASWTKISKKVGFYSVDEVFDECNFFYYISRHVSPTISKIFILFGYHWAALYPLIRLWLLRTWYQFDRLMIFPHSTERNGSWGLSLYRVSENARLVTVLTTN